MIALVKKDKYLTAFDKLIDTQGLYYLKYNAFLDIYDLFDRSTYKLYKSYTYKYIKIFVLIYEVLTNEDII